MAKGKKLATLFVAVTIAITLLPPVMTAVNSNTGTVGVANESVTADVGNWTELDGYDIDESTVAVEWYNETSDSYESVTEGTDYELNGSDGTIKALSGGDIGDGDELRVDYDYAATDQTTGTVAGLVPLFMVLLVVGILAAKVQGMV